MTFGITTTGFDAPSVADEKATIDAALLSKVSPTLDISEEGPIGQIRAVIADEFVSLWEALATAYGAIDPNKAEGVNLDNVCALSGTVRLPATKSEVLVSLNLNAAVTVPAGSILSPAGQPNVKFELVNTVISAGPGDYDECLFRCTVTGPVPANAGTLTVIVTPVSGWNTATNPADAALGRNVETDTALRARREIELAISGSSTADAIRADVLAVPGVIQCNVFENDTNVTNADGVPAHAFEVVIWDGAIPAATNAAIAEAIWQGKPAGIQAFGTTTVTHTDASGNVVNIGFTRAVQRSVYIDLTVVTDATFDTINGPAAVKQLVVNRGNALLAGDDVIALVIRAAALAQPGVTDVSVFELDFTAAPSATANLAISTRAIARFDTARVTVTVV